MSSKRKLEKLKLRTFEHQGKETLRQTEDQEQILQECIKFYDALFNGRLDCNLVDTGEVFAHSDQHLDGFLGSLDKLSEESKRNLVRPLEQEEVKLALQRCKSISFFIITVFDYCCNIFDSIADFTVVLYIVFLYYIIIF